MTGTLSLYATANGVVSLTVRAPSGAYVRVHLAGEDLSAAMLLAKEVPVTVAMWPGEEGAAIDPQPLTSEAK